MIDWFQRKLCGSRTGQYNPAARKAVEDARLSLDTARRIASHVHEVVESVREEGRRNHFIDLMYALAPVSHDRK